MANVLQLVLGSSEPLSRAGIAAATGLTKPTVSKLVDELLDARLLSEGDQTRQSKSGRPMTPINIASDSVVGLGLSISADHVSIRVRALSGDMPFRKVGCVPPSTPSIAAEQCGFLIDEAVQGLPQGCRIAGVTVAVPGRPDRDARRVISAPNLGWMDVDLARMIEEVVAARSQSIPSIRLVNDARIITQTEMLHRPNESFLLVYGATGIGGSMVLDGRIVDGANGWAGEVGHSVVDPAGPVCRCGKRGCLEAYAASWALRKIAHIPEEVTIDELSGLIPEDNLSEVADRLALAISNVVTVMDVPTVVLAGYFDSLYERMIGDIDAGVAKYALDHENRYLTVERVHVHEDAVLVGACVNALETVVADPLRWLNG